GLGRRTPVSDFPLQKRGGLGTLAVGGGRPAPIVGALEVLEGDELVLITSGGRVERIRADAVPVQGRRTQGRRVTKLDAGDRLVEVTRALPSRGPSGNGGPGGGGGVQEDDDEEDDVVGEDRSAGDDGAAGGPGGGQLDLLG